MYIIISQNLFFSNSCLVGSGNKAGQIINNKAGQIINNKAGQIIRCQLTINKAGQIINNKAGQIIRCQLKIKKTGQIMKMQPDNEKAAKTIKLPAEKEKSRSYNEDAS